MEKGLSRSFRCWKTDGFGSPWKVSPASERSSVVAGGSAWEAAGACPISRAESAGEGALRGGPASPCWARGREARRG